MTCPSSTTMTCSISTTRLLRTSFRGADTRCPRTRQPLNKKLIEALPQNKRGFKKFAPTRGIAKGCNHCKYPKDGRGCKHCILPYNGHGVSMYGHGVA